MAHDQQRNWCEYVRDRFHAHFYNKKVVDIGSLDINGNNRYLFTNCDYIGCDVAEGANVDIVSLAHELDYNDIDVVISTECFEHDMFYEKSLQNIVSMLKSGGLFLFTCATTGRAEHGTIASDEGFSSPLTVQFPEWADYYKNITREDVESAIDMRIWHSYEWNQYCVEPRYDLYFWGIKH